MERTGFEMKKRILSLLAMVCMLATILPMLPASAYDMGKTGRYVTISAGGWHTAAIKTDGSLWTWGNNQHGQLGDGTTEDRYFPTKIMDNVLAVSLGNDHSVALTEDGSLWTWGNNSSGQLGNGTTESALTPMKIMDNIAAVSAGGYYTTAIDIYGNLWTWGQNMYGQLCTGTTMNVYCPIQIMDDVIAVSAGSMHVAVIKKDHSLWTWGCNSSGQLGDGTIEGKYSPMKVMDNVKSVSAGLTNTAAIDEENTLWIWGYDTPDQMEDSKNEYMISPTKIMDNAISVSLGINHKAVIDEKGSLWIWGTNTFGQLGNGTVKAESVPIKIFDNVASVEAGRSDTAIIKTDGGLWTWGYNEHGQLGDGTTEDRYSPVKIMDGVRLPGTAPVLELDDVSGAAKPGSWISVSVTVKNSTAKTADAAVTGDGILELRLPEIGLREVTGDDGETYMTGSVDLWCKDEGTVSVTVTLPDGTRTAHEVNVVGEYAGTDEDRHVLRAERMIGNPNYIYYRDATGITERMMQTRGADTELLRERFEGVFDEIATEPGERTDFWEIALLELVASQNSATFFGEDEVGSRIEALDMLISSPLADEDMKTAAEDMKEYLEESAEISDAVEMLVDAVCEENAYGEGYEQTDDLSFMFESDGDDRLAHGFMLLDAMNYVGNLVKDGLAAAEEGFVADETGESTKLLFAAADMHRTLLATGYDIVAAFLESLEETDEDDIAAALDGRDWTDSELLWNIWLEDGEKREEYTEDVKANKKRLERADFYGYETPDIAKYIGEVKSTDVSDWAWEYTEKAVEYGILPDHLRSNYRNNITRAEFCTLLIRMLAEKADISVEELILLRGEPVSVEFDDAVYKDVSDAASLGIVNGVGDNNFNPLGEITRQQAATMLMRAAEVLGYDVSAPETNLAGVADWAADGVNFVVDRGIMTGTDNGFEPEGTYTKEQAITTMVRFYENLGD